MASRHGKTLISVGAIIVAYAGVFVLTGFVEASRPALPAGYEDEDLSLQGSRLKGFVFGAEGLLADWYWMNSLQYMGKKISSVGLDNLDLEDMTPLNPRLLYPYLNSATDLDPKFTAPYSYGATILPAIDNQQAIALTEKGIANNPDQWRLYQYLGYIYWKLGDYEKAAEIYHRGSQVQGAPIFLRMMAARMKTEGGSRDIAREMYGQLLAEAEDETSRYNAEVRLMQIDSLDERDILNPALKEYQSKNGKCPARWSDVLSILTTRKLANGKSLKIDDSDNVVDPSGVPYLVDAAKCEAQIDAGRSKVPAV